MKKQASGATVPITIVQLRNTATGQLERWGMDKFQLIYGQMNSQYEEFLPLVQKGERLNLPVDSPFRVNIHAEQSIGTASILLQYIYFNLDMNEPFNIISGETGSACGQVHFSLKPLWATDEQIAAVEESAAESIHDIPNLEYLDLEFNISRCTDLPSQFASDVRMRFELPSHISFVRLPVGYDPKVPPNDEQRKMIKRGGIIKTEVLPENKDVLNVNPEINFTTVLRIFNCDYRTREWFKTACLMLEVVGEPPDLTNDDKPTQKEEKVKQQENKVTSTSTAVMTGITSPKVTGKIADKMNRLHNATKISNATVAKVLADKGALEKTVTDLIHDREEAAKATDELEAELERLQVEMSEKEKKIAFASDELEEAKRRAKMAEAREQARAAEAAAAQKELLALKTTSQSDQLRQLQEQLAAAQLQAARDREALNKKSSACIVS